MKGERTLTKTVNYILVINKVVDNIQVKLRIMSEGAFKVKLSPQSDFERSFP